MNTDVLRSCPVCHAPITPEAPQGLCPKCLLTTASVATESGRPPESYAPPSREPVAAAFPHLEIFECIGQGGMGFVFKARQPKLDRFVALKLLPQKPDADPSFGERFQREARVLARLSHPHIVMVHDFGQAGSFFYLLMEFVDGVNLRQAMKIGRFTPAQALSIVPKICDALQYAHEEGVLHRDIKPENLLLDSRGRVKIADFGIAKLLGEAKDITLTGKGVTIGTPHYMAPEQLERPQDVDQRADIYSLGVVFYEMLTGELPIGRFAPPSEKAVLDPRVDDVVLRALEKERERRFQSAEAVKTQVENITSSSNHESQPNKTSHSAEGAAQQIPPLASLVDRQGCSVRALCAGSLVILSLLELAMVIIRGPRVEARGLTILIVFIGGPALVGTVLGWLTLRDLRRNEVRVRGASLAVLATVLWPMLMADAFVLLLSLLLLIAFQVHILDYRSEAMARLTIIVLVLTLIPLNILFVRSSMRRWNTERTLANARLAAFTARFSRPALWLTGFVVLIVLPALLILSLRNNSYREPVQVLPIAEPMAPVGFEVPPGGAPASDGHAYTAAISVPAGYALTLTGVLLSNRVVFDANAPTTTMHLLAPKDAPVEARLSWRLLGNTTLADGAPLEMSLSLLGSYSATQSFHVIPPEPIAVDWIGEPPRVWPPQNGHTKFVLVKGLSTSPEIQSPSTTEWAVAIDERLDAIPAEALTNLNHPFIGLGNNWLAIQSLDTGRVSKTNLPASDLFQSISVPEQSP